MTTPVTVRGVGYTLAQDGDKDVGAVTTQLLNAMINAINNSAISSTAPHYDAIIGSVAEIAAGEATHASIAAVLADAAITDGMSVFILAGTYTYAATLDITKRLTFINQSSDCYHNSTAAFAAGAILKFSSLGTVWKGGEIQAALGTPDYPVEINAAAVYIETQLSGAFATGIALLTSGGDSFIGLFRDSPYSYFYCNLEQCRWKGATSNAALNKDILFGNDGAGVNGDNSAGFRCASGVMQWKDRGGNWIDIQTAVALNVNLSNVDPVTAVNNDIDPAADNTIDLGNDGIEYKDIWLHGIKHNDAVDTTLNIQTTGNNNDIAITPHGTGAVIIDGTIEIETASILETTEDLTLQAVAANKDVILKTAATGRAKADVGGAEYNIPYVVDIQNYTTVGNVGDSNQFMAGNDYTLTELQHFFTAPLVISYYRFGAGAALGTDDVGTYNYTLGAAAKEPSNSTGIMNTNFAISFDGGDYATHATKFDDMTTTFSGVGKGLVHSFWVSAPADGQPAASSIFYNKTNSAANDKYILSHETNGQFKFLTNGNSATSKTVYSTSILPNGVNTLWTHVTVCWDTTYGLRVYINGICEATDTTATTLMVDGTTTDFFIGGADATPASPFTGKIANEVVINKVAEQRDIDFLFAATVPEPAILANKEYKIIEKIQPEADTLYEVQGQCQVVAKYNAKIYLQGRQYGSTDKVKLIGECD